MTRWSGRPGLGGNQGRRSTTRGIRTGSPNGKLRVYSAYRNARSQPSCIEEVLRLGKREDNQELLVARDFNAGTLTPGTQPGNPGGTPDQ